MEIQSADQYEQAYRASRTMMRVHVKAWLWSVCGILDVSVNGLARMAGVSPTTLYQFLHHQDHPSTPSMVTLRRISEVSKVPIARPILN